MSYQEASPREAKAQRPHRKFTPERIQQIKDLVARGETREQIAAARTVRAAREIATFTIDMKYKGQEHSTELPLAPDVIGQLALEASFRDQEIGELAKDILVSVFEKGLVEELLSE
jgi:hypothetical protein